MAVGGIVDNRSAVAQHLREAGARAESQDKPIDQNDTAYWKWVFGSVPEIIDLLTKE